MKKIVFYSSIIAISLILNSCASNETSDSNKVVQSEIYQSYSVDYDASNNELEVTAGFRFGGQNGTTLRLVDKSKVKYNNMELSPKTSPWTGTSYIYTHNGPMVSEHKFEYTNNDNETFVNVVPLLKADPILTESVISKSNNLVISWSGVPLTSKELIELAIQDSVQTYYFSPKIIGATSITVTPTELSKLKIGKGELFMRRTVSLSLQKGKPIGGFIESEYQSVRLKCDISK
jgi:hypothetical protein